MKPSMQRIDEATGRYIPVIYPEELPYWEGLKERKLKLQRCKSCEQIWFPIGPACPNCLSLEFDWALMSGRGVIHNYVVYHKAWTPWLEKRVPYAVIQVELDEGPRLTTNLLDYPVKEIKIGMRVEAVYEDVTAEITLLQFKPAKER
jgi:uncharacterized OB-fold protein